VQKADDDRSYPRSSSNRGTEVARAVAVSYDPFYARPLRRRDRCRLSPAPVSFASIRPNDEVIETEPAALIRGTLVRRFGVTER
jgi:hypothetical protein